MAFPIPKRLKKLWDEWNLRAAVLISLFFQIVLIFSAKSRKQRGNKIVIAIIWSVYLLADWIAAFSVGLISNGQSNVYDKKLAVSTAIAAFWAPFLLVHLGGPDTITAFSLEDNELWIRHLLGLVIQLLAVVYVFSQSISNEFWIPTVLVFFSGAIKYGERTRALYKACLSNFKSSMLPKPDSGPNYAQLMEEYSAMEASGVPVEIEIVKETEKGSRVSAILRDHSPEELKDIDVVLNGYRFFQTFKGLIVENMFSFRERNESRKFFFQRTAIDAFKVMEVELNFIYDALYTKMDTVHSKVGYLFRFISFLLILVSLQQFYFHSKHNIYHLDVVVTYILLIGAVGLEVVALINLIVSDWMIVLLNNHKATKFLSAVLVRCSVARKCRWSNTMSQHSLINFCLKERFRWINEVASFFGLRDFLDEFQYKNTTAIENNLKEFIFDELKVKALKADTRKEAKEIYSAKGDWILSDHPSHYSYPSISSSVSEDVEYDESLLLWHIATELCYHTSSDGDTNRKFCKWISDYMLYLLVMRPTLMSAVAGIAQIRYQDTCEEAKKFFLRWQPELHPPALSVLDECLKFKCPKFWNRSQERQLKRQKLACEKLDNVNTVVKPNEVKGDRSKSVLFDACILARDLKDMADEKRWKIMSKVWVELMSYAASHCRPNAHAQQLSRGGELIVFVWLLMAHFGLGDQFRIEAGHARAKLMFDFSCFESMEEVESKKAEAERRIRVKGVEGQTH
ncbi:hypothetical protein Fot_18185 [Forsythia ovata]|uniref:DUF4220 domain-containing protein n=1 Tax=Forsythia ovata TaxID=205694 RepID=A0ABD1VHI7_9LAMI